MALRLSRRAVLNEEKGTSFVGTIAKRRHAYVLKAADAEYLLNDRGQAKKHKKKRVKVTGIRMKTR